MTDGEGDPGPTRFVSERPSWLFSFPLARHGGDGDGDGATATGAGMEMAR